MSRLSHGTAATATAEAANPRNPVVEFTPRASSLACAIVAAADLTGAETRYANLLAADATYAKPGDARRWKVKPGEVYVMLGSGSRRRDRKSTTTRHAEALGLSVKRLHNLRVELKRQGVIEVRQCDRTRRAIVFVPTKLPAANWKPSPGVLKARGHGNAAGHAGGNAAGKSVPVPRSAPQDVPRSDPAREARRTCGTCDHSWPAHYPGGCGPCARKAKADDRQRAEAAQRVIDAVDRATGAEEQRQSAAIVAGTQAAFDLDAYQRAADKARALAQAITATHRRTA